MVNSIYSQLSVRLYSNPKFGKPMGPNRTNPYLFNASLEFPAGPVRLFTDQADFPNMTQAIEPRDQAKLSELILAVAVNQLGYSPMHETHFIAGQLFELNPKTPLFGALVVNMLNWSGFVFLVSDDGEVQLEQPLKFRFCPKYQTDKRKTPDYLATNIQLQKAEVVPLPAAPLMADQVMEILKSGQNRR